MSSHPCDGRAVGRLSGDQIRRRVRDLGEWFHNIDLDGVATAPEHFLGDYPALKWRRFEHTIPKDLRGASVLDIGCNAGFYCIEMKRRGADRVLGIDTDEAYLAQARFAAEVTGMDIEFRRCSVYRIADLKERFDLVLFMGVLYHLRHPLLALDLLHAHVVKDWLVFQSLMRGSQETRPIQPDYPFSERQVFEWPDFPKMFFIENSYSGDETNWWVPNLAAAEGMLRSAGFRIVDHPEEEVLICRRR